MASCINCKYCNKEFGSYTCTKQNKTVSVNEWCKDYIYPFSDNPQEIAPILIRHYQLLHNPLEQKLFERNNKSNKNVYKPYLIQNGFVTYYR